MPLSCGCDVTRIDRRSDDGFVKPASIDFQKSRRHMESRIWRIRGPVNGTRGVAKGLCGRWGINARAFVA
jgi:hypothetical protein